MDVSIEVVLWVKAYTDLGPVQREHLLSEEFVGVLVRSTHRITDRNMPEPSTNEILSLIHVIGTLMRRSAPSAHRSASPAPFIFLPMNMLMFCAAMCALHSDILSLLQPHLKSGTNATWASINPKFLGPHHCLSQFSV